MATWYYNLQSEVANRNQILENEVSVEYTYSDPFRKGAEKKTNIRFSVLKSILLYYTELNVHCIITFSSLQLRN